MTDGLELEQLDLSTDERGFLETDDYTRTDREHVLAIGDVTSEPMLAHRASAEGLIAAGEPAALDHQAIPAVVFTDREIGAVGMTEAEAAAADYDPIVRTFPLQASGRVLTTDGPDGFIRLVTDAKTDSFLGG